MTVSRFRLPGKNIPYVLKPGQGERRLVAGQVIRTLAGEHETGNHFGVVVSTCPQDPRPVPLHYHVHEHDTWFCLTGNLQVFIGDQSRHMRGGDFAYVKPGDVHSYQSHRECTEFFGIVLPGSWVEFFAAAGDDWDDEAYPAPGTVPFDFPKMLAAMGKYDVNLVRDAAYGAPKLDAVDRTLPGAHQSYFLESRHGVRHLLGSHISFLQAGGTETNGRFSLRVIEGRRGSEIPRHVHANAHEVIYVLHGLLEVEFNGETHSVPAGGMVSLSSGAEHFTRVTGDRTSWISAHSDPSADLLFEKAGVPTERFMNPADTAAVPGKDALNELCAGTDIRFL